MQKKLYKAIQLRESHLYNLSFGVRDGKSHISILSNFAILIKFTRNLSLTIPIIIGCNTKRYRYNDCWDNCNIMKIQKSGTR